MKGKQDGTKTGKIKQLLTSSSVGPFIWSRQPLPLIAQPGSSLSSHMNIHVHREAITELNYGVGGWARHNQQHHLLLPERKMASVLAGAERRPELAKAF